MLPVFNENISNETAEMPSLTWYFDTKNNTIKKQVNGLDAVKQAIYIALQTERYKYRIFTSQYGSELKNQLGKNKDYVFSEAQRMIRDALKPDTRITKVYDFKMSESCICFKINTVYGTTEIETEVITA